MAYNRAGLTCISNAGPNRIYHYQTNDTIAVVTASGYFNDESAEWLKGDVIHISGDLDGTPDFASCMISSADGAATVTTVT